MMNLKEAFRFQNKLRSLMDEAQSILADTSNLTQVANTALRQKVISEAENETTYAPPSSEYSEQITDVTAFLLYLLTQREALSQRIREAKAQLPIDMDGEVNLNGARQSVTQTLKRMADLRSSEVLLANGGTGYRFDKDGNQVTYRCPLKRVTTINFDRNVIRRQLTALNRKADEVSAELDRCLVNSQVDFEPSFDVNESFAGAFEAYLKGK